MNKAVLTLLLLFLGIDVFSQNTLWIHEYEFSNTAKSRDFHGCNRLIVKVTADSVFYHDFGKQEWTGEFRDGIEYTMTNDTMFLKKRGEIVGKAYKSGDSVLILNFGDNSMLLNKVSPTSTKLKHDKIASLIFNNDFVFQPSTLIDGNKITQDTIAFYDPTLTNTTESAKEIMILINIENYYFALMKFDRVKIYEILDINKNGFSINTYCPFIDTHNFKRIK